MKNLLERVEMVFNSINWIYGFPIIMGLITVVMMWWFCSEIAKNGDQYFIDDDEL